MKLLEINTGTAFERLNGIYRNPKYCELLNVLKELEADRIYCKHDEEHFLGVARIAYIKCLEQSLPVSKELLYCAAFLHDIGKSVQYTRKIPHEVASKQYAEEILYTEGFSEEEIAFICKLILEHRKGPSLQANLNADCSHKAVTSEEASPEDKISAIFYEADKQSRNCFCCKAADTCNWSEEKKNLTIK